MKDGSSCYSKNIVVFFFFFFKTIKAVLEVEKNKCPYFPQGGWGWFTEMVASDGQSNRFGLCGSQDTVSSLYFNWITLVSIT